MDRLVRTEIAGQDAQVFRHISFAWNREIYMSYAKIL